MRRGRGGSEVLLPTSTHFARGCKCGRDIGGNSVLASLSWHQFSALGRAGSQLSSICLMRLGSAHFTHTHTHTTQFEFLNQSTENMPQAQPELKKVCHSMGSLPNLNQQILQYMEKRLFVQLNGNRKVIGILRGYDVCAAHLPTLSKTKTC